MPGMNSGVNVNDPMVVAAYRAALLHQGLIALLIFADWLYLTGSRAQLEQVWRRYGVPPALVLPAGSMLGHGDYAFVIDQRGRMRREMGFDTGPGTQATRSSFAAELTGAARALLGHP